MKLVPGLLFGAVLGIGVIPQLTASENPLLRRLQEPKQSDGAKADLIVTTRTRKARRHLTMQLIPLLGNSPSPKVYVNELSLIQNLHLYGTIPKLTNLLMHRSLFGAITLSCVATLQCDPVGFTLSRLGEPAVKAIVPELRNPDRSVRLRVINVLAAMPENSARKALISARRNEQDAEVQEVLKSLLGS